MSNKIALNGEIVEGDRISLEVASEGFSFGFGLFETLKFKDRRPCFLKEHLERLVESAEAISMKVPYSLDEVFRQSKTVFDVNGVRNGVFKIVLTKSDRQGSFVIYLRDTTESLVPVPVRLRLSSVIKSSQAFTTNHKTLNYLENLLEKSVAQEHGFDECLFSNEAGYITECATANFFIIKDGVLKTPAVECGLLKGVIRSQILRIAREQGLRIEEGNLLPEECAEADEAFITSSGRGLVSVSEIWVDRSRTLPTIGSKLVRTLSEQVRLAENTSMEAFDR